MDGQGTQGLRQGFSVAGNPTAQQRDNPNLDFLRATAVTFVVVFHLMLYFQRYAFGGVNWRPLGQWGVLMFFVHTSLVLMLSMDRHVAKYGLRHLYGAFMTRRIFRLMPLSVLTVLLIYWMNIPLNFEAGHFTHARLEPYGLLSNLLLFQNITHADSIQAPLWSLPYELQMYVVLPALFLFARFVSSAPGMVFVWIAVALLAMEAQGAVRIPERFPHVPWAMLNYAPCFFAGIVGYRIGLPRVQLSSWLWPAVPLLATAVFLRNPSVSTSWFSCLLIGVAIPYFSPIRSRWLVRTSLVIARYSYSIYLTHFFCIWFAFEYLQRLGWTGRWLTLGVLLPLLPLLFYRLVERPMLDLGGRLAGKLTEARAITPALPARP